MRFKFSFFWLLGIFPLPQGFIVKKQRNKRLAQSQKRFFRLRGACLEYFSDEQVSANG